MITYNQSLDERIVFPLRMYRVMVVTSKMPHHKSRVSLCVSLDYDQITAYWKTRCLL